MTSQLFLSSEQQYYIYIHLYILEQLLLEAPREYIHSGLIFGLDWALCAISSILCLPYLSWPTQQLVTDSYFTRSPSLTTKRLNTAIQVNNMGAWYLMYKRHIYSTSLNITTQPFFYTSSTLPGRPAGPEHSCGEYHPIAWSWGGGALRYENYMQYSTDH
jgi:hypothetical protein